MSEDVMEIYQTNLKATSIADAKRFLVGIFPGRRVSFPQPSRVQCTFIPGRGMILTAARAAMLSTASAIALLSVLATSAVKVEMDVAEDAAAMMNMKKAEQPVLYQAVGRKSLKCWQCAVTMGE